MMMRSAKVVLEELVQHVGAPRGCAVVLAERQSNGPDDPNWVASTGIMDTEGTHLFVEKVAELRKRDTQIDWSAAEGSVGTRRIALWLSEVEAMVRAGPQPVAGSQFGEM
jgi:hypothetical protein